MSKNSTQMCLAKVLNLFIIYSLIAVVELGVCVIDIKDLMHFCESAGGLFKGRLGEMACLNFSKIL